MTLYDGWAPFYGERKSSAVVDIRQLYLAFVITALFFAFLLILPGVRGLEKFFFMLRWTISLLIGAVIVACGQGLSWQDASVTSEFRFSVFDNNVTKFNLGLHIGLQQFNVSLQGEPGTPASGIWLNEPFFYLTVDESLQTSLTVGTPFPILTVAEHFSSRQFSSLWPWGRKYWQSGHYASYSLWTALACWFLSNLLFNMVVQYGSLFLMITGILLLFANISFATVNSGESILIRVGYSNPAVLQPVYGWCFWLCLVVGLFCLVTGLWALIMSQKKSSWLTTFFMQKEDDFDLLGSLPRIPTIEASEVDPQHSSGVCEIMEETTGALDPNGNVESSEKKQHLPIPTEQDGVQKRNVLCVVNEAYDSCAV